MNSIRRLINWKLFFILWITSIIGGTFVIPYVLTNPLMASVLSRIPLPTFIAVVLLQSAIYFGVSVFLGLWLGEKVGLGAPFLAARMQGKPLPGFRPLAWLALGIGSSAGVLIFILDRHILTLFIQSITSVQDNSSWWSRLLACFYGGFNEEIVMRFALMTLLVWVSWKIKSTPENKPTKVGVWIAIITASVVFGLLHLPMTGKMVVITPLVIVRAIALNSLLGVPCGWLYWRKGLEAAIMAHFTCDIFLHGLLPLLT